MIVQGLPEAWSGIPLAEFAAGAVRAVDPQAHPDEVFDLYSVPAFQAREPEVVSGRTIRSNKQGVLPGDVLLCKIVPHLNRVWVVGDNRGRRQIASGEWVRYSTPAAEADYLRHLLSSPEFRADFMTTVSGVGGSLMRARPQLVDQIEVPLPPLSEQRRIVVKLDRLSARSRAARDHLARVATLIARLKRAVLATEFGDCDSTVDQYILSTFYGPRFAKTAYVGSGIPTLRTTDFRSDGRIELGAAPMVAVSQRDLLKWGLVDGDLLVTRTGSIGKCAVYAEDMGPALPSAYLIRVRLDLVRADPWFIYYAFASPAGQRFLGAAATAVTQPNVNAEAIRSVPASHLDLSSQREVVRRIESAFDRIDRLAAEAARAAHLLDRLDERLLHRAFRGELVPQDPADEPASVLLDRLRAAPPAVPPRRRGRGSHHSVPG